ncbi:MAG: hypothetical protein AAF441_09935 [Pseudomonadota bacterium]
MSEGLAGPVVMIRCGSQKIIGGPSHPSQRFNLEKDPCELNDPAHEPQHREAREQFEEMMAATWNFDALTADILLSQRRCEVIQTARQKGSGTLSGAGRSGSLAQRLTRLW